MTKKPRFTIGQEVVVSAKCWLHYPNGVERKVTRIPYPEPRNGWIVGARRRRLGTYDPGYGHGSDDPTEPRLIVTGTVLVWLVAFDMLRLPVEVLDEDVSPSTSCQWPPHVPWCPSRDTTVWDDRARGWVREQAASQPRVNGRFVKQVPTTAATAAGKERNPV